LTLDAPYPHRYMDNDPKEKYARCQAR